MANEKNHLKKGMGGSNRGRSRTQKTKPLKHESKKMRRAEGKKEVQRDIKSLQ